MRDVPDNAGGPVLQAWCPTCRQMSMPDARGRCVWCDTQTGGADPAALAPAPAEPERWHLRKGEPGYGPACPECGGPKSPGSRRCAECRRAAGHRGPDRDRRRLRAYLIDDETLEEARRLYATGLSMRQVAAAIFERTGYRTTASCTNALHALFRRRGWPLRSRSAVTAARNYRHGRGDRGRDEAAYRRFLRERGLGPGPYRPRCAGVRTNYPRKGAPCQRPAMVGSDYCQAHDPARALARDRHLERARAIAAAGGLPEAA